MSYGFNSSLTRLEHADGTQQRHLVLVDVHLRERVLQPPDARQIELQVAT